MILVSDVNNGIELLIKELQIPDVNGNFGSTVSLIAAEIPESGYMVGGYVDSLIFDVDVLTHGDLAYRMILRWLTGHLALATKFSVFLGGWVDSDTDLVYVDLAQHFIEKSDALAVAAFQDEIAIWDLKEAKEIRVTE